MKKHLFPVLLWGALCVASPVSAQDNKPADAAAIKPASGLKKASTDDKSAVDVKRMADEAKDEKSSQRSVSALRSEQVAFKPASVALAPDSMTRPKDGQKGFVNEIGLRTLKLRRERAQAIQAHAADLKRELVANKADAKHIKALDGLIADAKAVEAGVVALVGEDGKRAFDAGDGVSKKLAASDAQAKRLQASLESTLGLVEPWISR